MVDFRDAITRLAAITEGTLVHTHRWPGGSALTSRAEARVNAARAHGCMAPHGAHELHALDAQNMRRAISAMFVFDGLMDLELMDAALRRTVSRYPVVAGWLTWRWPGTYSVKWDASAPGAGMVWVRAEARGAPPECLDSLALQQRRLMPPLRRHALLAIQATHFPEANVTLLAASVDHVVADMQSFIDFLTAWCNDCSALRPDAAVAAAGAARGGAPAGSLVPMPSPPSFDRAPLVHLPALPSDAAESSSEEDSGDSAASGDGPAGGDAGGSGAAADAGAAPPSPSAASSVSSDSSAAESAGRGIAASGSSSSLSSWASGASEPSFAQRRAHRSLRGRFWQGPAIWEADPFCQLSTAGMIARILWAIVACRNQTWRLPRSAIDALKSRLGGAMPGKAAPTANDVLSSLLAAGMAWLHPERVARRGGMCVNVVVNARGRFGLEVAPNYFGTNSFPIPIWVPADLLLPADDAAAPAKPLPSPELVAYLHTATREALAAPDGLVRRRYEWMAGAQRAGVGGCMRACEAVGLLEGDVTVDNVSNFPIYHLKFGSDKVARSAATRFVQSPRLAWVQAAGPADDRSKGGPNGDLLVSVPMPAADWARLRPWWEAAGLQLVFDVRAGAYAASHPASIRYLACELTRTALAGF